MRALTTSEQPNISGGKSLEGGYREVNRGGVAASGAGIGDSNIDGLALPRDPDLLAAVLGLGASASISAGIEGSDKVIVRVNSTTSTGDTILSEPGEAERGVRR